MTPERRTHLVGQLARVAALAGRIHRHAAYEADAIACDDSDFSVDYSALESWRRSLEQLDGLVVELLADLSTPPLTVVDGPHLEGRAKTVVVANRVATAGDDIPDDF